MLLRPPGPAPRSVLSVSRRAVPQEPPMSPNPAAQPIAAQPIAAQPIAAQPTAAFVGAAWAALLTGCTAYLVGLYNAQLALSEKGFYLTVLLYGLFAVVSLQKSVRDRLEGIHVTGLYFGLAWISVAATVVLLTAGLWNSGLAPSEKGFYAMAFTLSLFSAVTVQKNVRDLAGATAGAVPGVPATPLASTPEASRTAGPAPWGQQLPAPR